MKHEDGIAYGGKVHAVFACEECEFTAEYYRDSLEEAKAHYTETGHDLTGEVGYAYWIGIAGKKKNQEKYDQVMISMGFTVEQVKEMDSGYNI